MMRAHYTPGWLTTCTARTLKTVYNIVRRASAVTDLFDRRFTRLLSNPLGCNAEPWQKSLLIYHINGTVCEIAQHTQ